MPSLRWRWTHFPFLLTRMPWLFLSLIIPLTLLIMLADRAGGALPQPPLYLDQGRCAQPCWQGLQPGTTRLADALDLVQQLALFNAETLVVSAAEQVTTLRWETRPFPSYDVQARFRGDVLLRLDLNVDGLVLLGDVLALFGEPSHVALCPRIAASFNYRRAISATLYFYDGALEVWAYLPNTDRWQVRPDMRVLQLTYRTAPPPDEPWLPLGAAAWHGFGRTGYSAGCR